MSASTRKHLATELVPIAERRRYLQAFRLLLVAAVVAVAATFPQALLVPVGEIAVAAAVYVVLSAAGHLALRRSSRRGLLLFGAMLMIDGLFLAWAAWATGGAASPVRLLVIPHLVTVALLASYRTGLKLVLWHSLLLLVVHYSQEGGLIAPTPAPAGLGTPLEQLIAFSAVAWVATLATATFSAVNERELRRRRYDLEALARMTARLEAVSEPQAVAGLVIDSVADTFGFRRALVLDLRDGRTPAVLGTHGLRSGPSQPPSSGLGLLLRDVIDGRVPRLVRSADPHADPWLCELMPGARKLVLLPLIAENEVVGVLIAEHGGGPRIERQVLDMVQRFTAHGALALANAWLLERIRRLADTDGLTGVANRRTLDAALARELARASRHREDLSVVMLDVDHFKRLNDVHGHQVGDEVLRRVADTLQSGMRPFDTVARYGGEEFAVLLPRTSADDAVQVAERLRRAIARAGKPAVTVSAGVSTFPLDSTEPAALMAAADAALYASKAAGRDRVSAASDPAPKGTARPRPKAAAKPRLRTPRAGAPGAR